MSRPTRRLLAFPAAAALLVGLAAPASAHVSVQPSELEQGSYAKLTFRMPSERDVATTKLEVAFPDEHPIASVRVKPHAGWTVEIVKGAPATPLENHGSPVEEVVQTITWTAQGEGVRADEFEEFEVSAGPMPEADQLVFKALQTYADGDVVRWIEEEEEGAPEPEKPAPVLQLVPASADGHSGASTVAAEPANADDSSTDAENVAATEDTSANTGLSVAALVIAGLALLTALGSLLRGRGGRSST
jgi:uncharacterized protein YcnI